MAIVRMAGEIAADRGQALYLVGGAVRDLLLGRINIDLDLVVEGDALELAHYLSEKLEAKIIAHDRFGTAKLISGGFYLDLVTARSESYERPGALPSVKPGSLQDDLRRRDFTINAMALGLSPSNLGNLIDPFGGRADLENRLLRILHEQSFIDDATRLFRAIRYEHRLKFNLEKRTEELARRDMPYLDTISGDRLRRELELILAENEPEGILRRADELGILARLNPHLKGDGWLAGKFVRAREVFQPKQPPLGAYLSLMVWSFDPVSSTGQAPAPGTGQALDECEKLAARLNLPSKIARIMRDTLRLKKAWSAWGPGMKNSEVYRQLSRYLPPAIQTNIIAADNPPAIGYMQLFLNVLRSVKVEIDGAHLKSLGAPQGPALGKILHQLHMAKLDRLVKNRADEEEMALELIKRQPLKNTATNGH